MFTTPSSERWAFVIGPFPTTMHGYLTSRLEQTTSARRALGIEFASSSVEQLVLHHFPTSKLKMMSGVERERPALFIVHVPYQYGGDTLKTRRAVQKLCDENGLRKTRFAVFHPEWMAKLIAYVDVVGSAGSMGFFLDNEWSSYLSLSLDVKQCGSDTYTLSVTGIHYALVIDDLGLIPETNKARIEQAKEIFVRNAHQMRMSTPGNVLESYRLRVVNAMSGN